MRRIPIIAIIFVALAVAATAEERFIVRVDGGGDEAPKALFERLGLKLNKRVRADEGFVCVVSSKVLPPNVVEELLRNESAVRSVEPVRPLGMAEVENGKAREDSYAVARRHGVGAELQNLLASGWTGAGETPWSTAYALQADAWGLELDKIHRKYGKGKGIVAFIDTGVDPLHPQLKGSLVQGYDFVHDRPGIPSEWDDLDSETLTELYGTTGALVQQSTVAVLDGWEPAIVNQSTVAVLDQAYGRAPFGSAVSSLRARHDGRRARAPRRSGSASHAAEGVFESDGTGDTATIAEAIYYAVDHDASVINMSFSFDHFSMEVMRALNYATRRGVITIAAAGNRGEAVMVFPAAFANVPGIAGLALDGSRSSISNFGEDLVSVAAPGEELVSTYPGAHFAVGFGTSFSAALVSGAASLMKGIDKDVEPADIERALARGRKAKRSSGMARSISERSLEWLSNEQKD